MAVLAIAAPATAAVRYASPSGNFENTNECTDPSNPCELQHAVDKAVTDDEVVVGPGTYNRAGPVDIGKKINVHGVAGQQPPRIVSAGSGPTSYALQLAGSGVSGGTVRYLDIESPAGAGIWIRNSGAVLQELTVEAGDVACFVPSAGATFLDTLCRSSGGKPALQLLGIANGATSTFVLRNVTAIGATALEARHEQSPGFCSSGCTVDVTAVNTIARGTGLDVAAWAQSPSSTTVTLSYSNFDPGKRYESSPNAHVMDGGHNQVAPPVFAGVTDFHQAAGSPTIDAGLTDDAANGPFDFDGQPRTLGGATDIGADEFVPLPPGGAGDGGAGGGGGTSLASPTGASLRGSRVRATSRRVLAFPLANPNVFAVTGDLAVRSSARLAARRRVVFFGKKRFAMSARGRRTVRLKLSRTNFALLKRLKSIRAKVTIVTRATGRPARTATRTVVLKSPKRKGR